MSLFEIIMGSVLLACALFLIVIILIQQGKKHGLSGAIAGGSSDTYLGKNKGASRGKKLIKITTIVSIIFSVIVLAAFLIQ